MTVTPFNLYLVSSNETDDPILAITASTKDQVYLCHKNFIEKVQLHKDQSKLLERFEASNLATILMVDDLIVAGTEDINYL